MSTINSAKRKISFRAGFSYIEVVISTALVSLLSSYYFMAIISMQRLYEATIADIELSLQSRMLREKLLFNVVEGEGGLMNASKGNFEFKDVNNPKKKSDTLTYRMNGTGPKTKLAVSGSKMTVDRGRPNKFSTPGSSLASSEVFALSSSGGQINLTLDLVIVQRQKQYRLRQEFPSPFLNE